MTVSCHHDRAHACERILELTAQVSDEVVAGHADDVDREGRFPSESIEALKRTGLLSVMVPAELGGAGCDVATVVEMCATLGRRCASTAMIFAMHQIQVASIVAHRGCVPELDDYLRDLIRDPRLIASVTSEVGTGGDLRRSLAALALDSDRFSFEKASTTISYCEQADDFLVTVRRNEQAAAGDQALVLVCRGAYDLKEIGTWDTLGMRGTCSPPATLAAAGASWQILSDPFRTIAMRTMVPVSHLFWAGVWLGIATDAFERARRFVQISGRKNADAIGPAATRLAAIADLLAGMRARIEMSIRTHERIGRSPDVEEAVGIAETLEFNELKLATSSHVVEIVDEAMQVIGVAAYRNSGSASLGRHLRDAHSARLMINNDRIRATNAELLQVYKGRGRIRGPA